MPSFAHELLHLRLYARGYRHILAGGNLDVQKRVMLSQVLSTLEMSCSTIGCIRTS